MRQSVAACARPPDVKHPTHPTQASRRAGTARTDLQVCEQRRNLRLGRLSLSHLDEVAALHVQLLGAPARERPPGHVLSKPRHLTVGHKALWTGRQAGEQSERGAHTHWCAKWVVLWLVEGGFGAGQ